MGQEKTTLGSIHISPNAIATIAYHATPCNRMAWWGWPCQNLAEGIANTITREPTRWRERAFRWR